MVIQAANHATKQKPKEHIFESISELPFTSIRFEHDPIGDFSNLETLKIDDLLL